MMKKYKFGVNIVIILILILFEMSTGSIIKTIKTVKTVKKNSYFRTSTLFRKSNKHNINSLCFNKKQEEDAEIILPKRIKKSLPSLVHPILGVHKKIKTFKYFKKSKKLKKYFLDLEYESEISELSAIPSDKHVINGPDISCTGCCKKRDQTGKCRINIACLISLKKYVLYSNNEKSEKLINS